MSDTFDPSKHLRRLRGKGGDADYLDVKWRIVWLRHEHPEAIIITDKVAGGMEANYAEFTAKVIIPGGGSATGYGSETKADFGDFIEKAETKALGRAIAALGYGTQFVGNELDEGERIVDSPVKRKPEDDDGHAAAQPAPPRDNQSARTSRADPSPLPPSSRPAVVPSDGGPPPTPTDEAGTYTVVSDALGKILDEAWQKAEDGKTLDDIRNYLNAMRHGMTKDERQQVVKTLAKIEKKWYAPADVAG